MTRLTLTYRALAAAAILTVAGAAIAVIRNHMQPIGGVLILGLFLGICAWAVREVAHREQLDGAHADASHALHLMRRAQADAASAANEAATYRSERADVVRLAGHVKEGM